jgi:hypothetical protein
MIDFVLHLALFIVLFILLIFTSTVATDALGMKGWGARESTMAFVKPMAPVLTVLALGLSGYLTWTARQKEV